MQLNRCPVCHTRISLDALAQDEAGRELLGLLMKLDTETGPALVGYLSLFRSASRDLANDRALKLAREALGLGHHLAVAQAMRLTVDSLQGKSGKPLSNHNYLKKVLEDVTAAVGADSSALVRSTKVAPTLTKTSKTAQALQSLEDFGHAR
ncbi:MAG: hypothetical protein PSU93_09430 [Methylobacter sp.]|uniref:Uncharacterized protein n=1 Tax=Candidatus Methylobacter titanis TaxID=3053457 RepID=A0AA43Q6A9_9GAMM|nr:hypothetical protein [Candidatus Methylobacter titanis]